MTYPNLVRVRVRGKDGFVGISGKLTPNIEEAAMFHPDRARKLYEVRPGVYEQGATQEFSNEFEFIPVHKNPYE